MARQARSRIFLTALVLASLSAVGGMHQRPKATSWREQAAQLQLSRKTIARLEKNGIVLTDTVCKQVFEPYLDSQQPAFITSDSVLAAWRVLFEETVRRYETRRARTLPKVLRTMLGNLPRTVREFRNNRDEVLRRLLPAAERRARLVLGVALRLLDPAFRLDAPELDRLVAEEVARIESDRGGVDLPKWLGPTAADFLGLDYTRLQPCGFYTVSDRLRRYFRAVAWLQSVPFRSRLDEELLAAMLLARSAGMGSGIRRAGGAKQERATSATPELDARCLRDFLLAFRDIIGPPDDLTLEDAANAYSAACLGRVSGSRHKTPALEIARRAVRDAAARRHAGQINDLMRYPPETGNGTAAPTIRILPAYRTPSAILFHVSVNQPHGLQMPSGLEVAAALGSDFAVREVSARFGAPALRAIGATRTVFDLRYPHSLNDRYLYALRALAGPQDPAAPDFMKTRAWAVKSCNTILAGWAQMRHTWALQAKPSAAYAGATRLPSGFVEPSPVFFARMAVVAHSAFRMFHEAGALDSDIREYLPELRKLHDALLRLPGKESCWRELGYESRNAPPDLPSLDTVLAVLHAAKRKLADAVRRKDFAAQNRIIVRRLAEVIEDLEKTNLAHFPKVAAELRRGLPDLAALWPDFSLLCSQLGGLARKELQRRPFDDDEERLITVYGMRLAGLMLYQGNAYLTPRDEAPVIVDVHTDSSCKRSPPRLHVGTARPRQLLVLFPWQGRKILCVGAVVPYCEFVDAKRYTDAEWRKRLDTLSRPPIPEWLNGF